jgi:hypothetical protein
MKSFWGRTVPRVLLIAVTLVAVLFSGARLYGARRWNSGTRGLRARLNAARVPVRPRTVDFRELEGLPAPVSRYFHTVLEDEQPMVSAVEVRHTGTFNTGESEDRWKPFTSDQWVVTRRPGFDWNAQVAMMPGLPGGVRNNGTPDARSPKAISHTERRFEDGVFVARSPKPGPCRISWNAGHPKFGEYPFHALGCTRDRRATLAKFPT